ncbi:MAG: tyrosine-type recombinase/integrase [Streptosporangiaceae bacterium]
MASSPGKSGGRRANGESWKSEGPNAQGYYEAFVWMGTKADGTADRRHVKRRTEASRNKAVRELERKRDAGQVGKPGKVKTVRAMLDRHLDVVLPQRERAPKTIIGYRSLCKNQIYPRWGGQRIGRLLPEQLEDGYAEMRARGLAASSIRKVHAILSSAYEIEVRRGNVARNPCKLVEPPRLGQPKKAALTQQQARAVLDVVGSRRNAARWSVGLACGLRQGEVLGLRWPYVNLDSGELRVWFQLQRLPWRHGCPDVAACTEHRHRRPCPRRCPKALRKSGRPHVCIPASDLRICPPGCTRHAATCPDRQGGGLVFREIKERRRKTVALPPELVAVLKAQREAQDLERETAANLWHDHGVVFACEDGRLIDPSADLREWSAILAQAGIPHAGTHTMRHSAATIALEEGVALAVVQEMLGHSDIRVTRGYSHVSSVLAQDGAARVGRALFGESATKTATKSHDP